MVSGGLQLSQSRNARSPRRAMRVALAGDERRAGWSHEEHRVRADRAAAHSRPHFSHRTALVASAHLTTQRSLKLEGARLCELKLC